MKTGSRCAPSYRLLSQKQIEELHRGTLEILETVGVKVLDPEARDMLAGAGCSIQDGEIARIPAELVEESIRSAPSGITMYDRSGRAAMQLEGRNTYFGMGTDLLHTLDPYSGESRASRVDDVVRAAVVADACAQIDFVASHAFPADVPPRGGFLAAFKALVGHTVKPVYFTAADDGDLESMLSMAAAIAGGPENLRRKPFLIHYAEPTSPLVHSAGAIRKMFLCADRGIPLTYAPALMCGATGPVTLAGALCVASAEALSGLVLHQLRAPGAPMISGVNVTPLDMGKGTATYGSPEERLTQSACADLYHFYGLPVWGTAGCSDAHRPDAQAGYEYAVSLLFSALDGANLVHDVGYLGQGLVGSLAGIVMADEMIGHLKRILRGFDLGEETLALDAIRRVGPGGDFLADEHTLHHFSQELWQPRDFNRDGPEQWARKGGMRYGERAAQRARDILEHHRPVELPAETMNALEEIYRQALEELGPSGRRAHSA